jgi:predicted 3-demethylubiquinone-9 3-methyltransferase (glyoxalase superfamily)
VADKALITCLWFDTEGEAAAKHYASIFKDSKLGRIVPYGEAGRREAEMTMLVERRRAEPRQEPIFGGKGSSPAFHGPGL